MYKRCLVFFWRGEGARVFLRAIYGLQIISLAVIYYLRNKGYSVDDSFITYRYAYHLKEGFGLVFNVGENYYGTTAAGYAVILALASRALDILWANSENIPSRIFQSHYQRCHLASSRHVCHLSFKLARKH